jgi:UDP-N-acetylmuramate dehydrogenase
MIPNARPMKGLRGKLRINERMSKHTSWRVGGPADYYYIPADLDDLTHFVAGLPASEPLTWVGLGSNLLVRDGGIRGTVIATSGALSELGLHDKLLVRAEVGVACAKLARFSVQQGLSGAEFFAGIPGTVGGALAMNAGAFGGETWGLVQAVEVLDRHGRIQLRPPSEFTVGYRSVVGKPNEWFVAGHFRLVRGAADGGKALIKSLLAKRGATQPTHLPNAGSVFRNPPGDHAARLIESAGLKGLCEGDACVSELHANFIVNRGGASALQIERLIGTLQARVEQAHGVRLEPEVRILGEALPGARHES